MLQNADEAEHDG